MHRREAYECEETQLAQGDPTKPLITAIKGMTVDVDGLEVVLPGIQFARRRMVQGAWQSFNTIAWRQLSRKI
jgi:hypothetical protein